MCGFGEIIKKNLYKNPQQSMSRSRREGKSSRKFIHLFQLSLSLLLHTYFKTHWSTLRTILQSLHSDSLSKELRIFFLYLLGRKYMYVKF